MEAASPLLVLFLISLVIERVLEVVSPFVEPAGYSDNRRAEMKALFMFLIGSVIGGAICLIGQVNIFRLSGLALNSDVLSYLLTGIAVGGGTKPLHDAISSLSKYRDLLRRQNNGVVKPTS